jgi:putative PIG3 family NAD(P)H quinone oxidoreductase
VKAVYIKEFGSVAGLELRDVPDPSKPAGSKVLVRVKAAGLNRADVLQVKGHYPPPPGYSPNVPGMEFSGEIVEIGNDVGDYAAGDRIFGITAGEAQAEYLTVDASVLARIPDGIEFNEAACVPEVFITANDAINTQAQLQSGEAILIHAVGSGVGLAALQLAKAQGATTIGTSRTADKLERCREFGLDFGISAGSVPLFSEAILAETGSLGVNVILDLVGGTYFSENLKSLSTKGRLMLVGLTAGRSAEFDLGIALYKRITIRGTVLRGRSVEEKARAVKDFEAVVLPLLVEGKIRPNLDRVFPASDVVEAYKYLASNESFGKVVLQF